MALVDFITGHVLLFGLFLAVSMVAFLWSLSILIGKLSETIPLAILETTSLDRHLWPRLLLVGLFVVGLSHMLTETIGFAFDDGHRRSLDRRIMEGMYKGSSPTVLTIFSCVTVLGGAAVKILLGLAVAGWLNARRHHGLLAVWVFGLVGGSVLVRFLKASIYRQRPLLQNPLLVDRVDSFPSGHTASAVILLGLSTYLVFLLAPRHYRYLALNVSLVLGTLVGLSRVVLGVHYFSDVLAGWLVGLLWVAFVVTVSEVRRSWRIGEQRGSLTTGAFEKEPRIDE